MTPAKPKEPPRTDAALALDLFSIAGSLNSTLDLDYLLEKIGTAAERLLDAEASSIMLVTEDKKSLYFKVAGGDVGSKLKTMTLPIGQGIAGWVAEHREHQVVNDTKTDPRFAGKFDKASGFVTRSLLCVPMLLRGGELVGVVEVLNKRGEGFSPEDVKLLSGLASLASVAISNAKLISEQKNFFSHILEILCMVIENSKPNMQGHPARCAKLACAIARVMGLEDYDYRMLYYAGLLHDIGYVAINNPAVLSEIGVLKAGEEMHPTLSVKLLEGIRMVEGALPIISHHHERYDGGGFPGKLSGEQIPAAARILHLVEDLEELRMVGLRGEELYRKALKEAVEGSGRSFDPEVVEAFKELMSKPEGVW